MRNVEFLLEIGCEEIPARMLKNGISHLEENFKGEIKKYNIKIRSLKTYYTARRLILVSKLSEKEEDREEVVFGPPKKIAVDEKGNFTKAAIGFARKNKIELEDISFMEKGGSEYLAFKREVRGKYAKEILSDILPQVIKKIPFRKTMYWREDKFRFVRPIRNILSILDGEVVNFEMAGVKSSNKTFGHRFLGAKEIEAKNFRDYVKKLSENFVMVDVLKRRDKVLSEFKEIEERSGFKIFKDNELLEEVINLNEYPTAIMGNFDRNFLKIPEEVLITVMRKHQKYFYLVDGDSKLVPHFITVINLPGDETGEIKEGHERVLRARLEDGKFFYQKDLESDISSKLELLKDVLFQEELGTYYDKVVRMSKISSLICDKLKGTKDFKENIEKASLYSKCDLLTEMVGEFPELQGIMGGIYSREQGYPEEIWKSIYYHYKPENFDDEIPPVPGGRIVSLSDKIDTLIGIIIVSGAPTGSKDPFGLRRMANGIYKILIDGEIELNLKDIFDFSFKIFSEKLKFDYDEKFKELVSFLSTRVEFVFKEKGFLYDEVRAILRHGIFKPYDGLKRLNALKKIRGDESFNSIFLADRRIKNIISKQDYVPAGNVDVNLFEEEEEEKLYGLYLSIEGEIRSYIQRGKYNLALEEISRFSEPLENFFDKVFVMSDNIQIRKNRLELLKSIGVLFESFCDFSEFVKEKK